MSSYGLSAVVASPSSFKGVHESLKFIPHRVKKSKPTVAGLRAHAGSQLLSDKAIHFRPCIDIHKGKVKQIVGSTLIDSDEYDQTLVTNFESDKSPAEFAKLYRDDGLVGGHVIMLTADSVSRSATIDALHSHPGGLHVGGGINLDNALTYIDEGASHVIVTSYVFNNAQMDLGRLKDIVHVVGKDRLVLDLSCRKKEGRYFIATNKWQKFTDVCLNEELLDFLAMYADEFLVHGVDVEGKKLGIDTELVALLGKYSPAAARAYERVLAVCLVLTSTVAGKIHKGSCYCWMLKLQAFSAHGSFGEETEDAGFV